MVHPERLADALLDVDVAHTRRNRDSILSVIRCVCAGLRSQRLILGDRWLRLRVPTLFVYGERDTFMGSKVEKAWKTIAAGNPNVQVVRIPGAGHLPWIDDPERVVAEMERFLATEPRSGVEAAAQSPQRSPSPAAKANASA